MYKVLKITITVTILTITYLYYYCCFIYLNNNSFIHYSMYLSSTILEKTKGKLIYLPNFSRSKAAYILPLFLKRKENHCLICKYC